MRADRPTRLHHLVAGLHAPDDLETLIRLCPTADVYDPWGSDAITTSLRSLRLDPASYAGFQEAKEALYTEILRRTSPPR